MSNLIRHLNAFNRKERFFLIRFALGSFSVALDSAFRDSLGEAIGVTIPPTCRWWTDYHLDWLYAALILNDLAEESSGPFGSPGFLSTIEDQPPFNVNSNQEDVDLLLAFDSEDVTHLVLIEAKADTGWKNKQLQSKAGRLKVIFGDGGTAHHAVVPHFVITSPREPRGLKSDGLPSWMTLGGVLRWVKLQTPADWLKIERCDAEGRPTAAGAYWQVK